MPDFQVGDRVWGFLNTRQATTAAAADYVAAPVESVSLRPRSIDTVAAAGLSAVGATAIGVLRDDAQVQPGDRVLIPGAAGGVGSAAVQVALALGGRVTALGSAKHQEAIRALGAEAAFDYHTTNPRDLGTSMLC